MNIFARTKMAFSAAKAVISNQAVFLNKQHAAADTNSPRTKNWNTPATGPNSALRGDVTQLRNRSRDLYRENGWYARGINSLVDNEVGRGITPRSRASDESIRKRINEAWHRTQGSMDADGIMSFYGLQNMASRGRNLGGEVFIRKRSRRPSAGMEIPLQIQVLEADYVPVSYSKDLPDGRTIYAGIEFDKRGRRLAYHMYKSHPNDGKSMVLDTQLVRVPANQVIHHFMPTRPGQVRGEPVGVQSLLALKDFVDYSDAELLRKKSRAPFTGFMTREEFDEEDYKYDPFTGAAIDSSTDPVNVNVNPGTIFTGYPGEKLTLFDGDKTSEGFSDYAKFVLQSAAAGMDAPYELMTGDWSNVNDRLVRAILNEFHRRIQSIQDLLMIHQFCAPAREWWLDAAVLSAALALPRYEANRADYLKTEWRPDGWAYVHPLQDAQANKILVEEDFESRAGVVAERGTKDFDEIVEENKEADAKRGPRESPGDGATNMVNFLDLLERVEHLESK